MSSRAEIAAAKRIVIKVGSSSLTLTGGGLNSQRIASIVSAIANVKTAGKSVVLVSSG
ncbi:MAG: glutamate 5-kinase, partial [Candidatus Nanopelagicales bacterium]